MGKLVSWLDRNTPNWLACFLVALAFGVIYGGMVGLVLALTFWEIGFLWSIVPRFVMGGMTAFLTVFLLVKS